MKVWDRARIELATPRSAVRLASVARHVTDCATWPVVMLHIKLKGITKRSNMVAHILPADLPPRP